MSWFHYLEPGSPQTAEFVPNCLRNARLSTPVAALAGKRLLQSDIHFSCSKTLHIVHTFLLKHFAHCAHLFAQTFCTSCTLICSNILHIVHTFFCSNILHIVHAQMSPKHTVEFGVRGAAGSVCIGRCSKLQKSVMEME